MTAKTPINRATVDLSAYPDLVVVYLGMQAKTFRGLLTLMRQAPQIGRAVAAKPDGLLRHENLFFSIIPVHLAMRQYWRDLDSLERWTREGIHRDWWTAFLKDPGGTGFWHETYRLKGGFEAIYDDVAAPLGLLAFAPQVRAKGPMFSARARLAAGGVAPPAPVTEAELG